jgi:uncharacterized membrane protein YphA (DoxX/SURF4 family)
LDASTLEPAALAAADRVIGETRGVWAARLAGRIAGRLLGALILAAGLLKAAAPAEFAQQIAGYGIVTNPVVTALIGYAIVIVECGLGAALLVNLRPRVTLVVAAVLLTAFLVLVGWAWSTNATENCGCFGPWTRSPQQAFFEDLVLLAVAVWAWWGRRFAAAPTNAFKLALVGIALAAGIMIPAIAGFASNAAPGSAGVVGSTAFSKIEVTDPSADLANGDHLVLLMSTNCPHCKDAVPAVNALVSDGRLPRLTAIAMEDRVDRGLFREDYKAAFDIGQVSQQTVFSLLEKQFPRLFLVRNGRIVAVWDELPPADAVLAAMARS